MSTESILREVAAERERQITKGYTPEHDDAHHGVVAGTNSDLIRFMRKRLDLTLHSDGLIRRKLVEVAALAVAAIEGLDRKSEARS